MKVSEVLQNTIYKNTLALSVLVGEENYLLLLSKGVSEFVGNLTAEKHYLAKNSWGEYVLTEVRIPESEFNAEMFEKSHLQKLYKITVGGESEKRYARRYARRYGKKVVKVA